MTRPVTDRAKAIARKFEGYRDKAYLCPARVWTLAYGHTKGVKEGDTCTRDQAEHWLDDDFFDAARAVEAKIGEANYLALTDNQHDALCDFVFNLGTGDPGKPEWQIWKLLRARQYDQIPAQLARFVYSGKTKLNGLVARRNAEIALWSEAEPGAADMEASSAELRVTATPPAAMPALFSPTHLAAAAVAGAGGIAEGAKSVTQIIQPYADQSQFVQHMLSYAATAGAVAAVAVAGLAYLQSRRAKQ